MSRYPPNTPSECAVKIEMKCESCNNEWLADGNEDLGQCSLDNENEQCPECGE